MSRPFVMPDPKDRSVNEPSVVVGPNQILGYYNQLNKNARKERVVESVQQWYVEEAKRVGWSDARFSGNQCILTVYF